MTNNVFDLTTTNNMFDLTMTNNVLDLTMTNNVFDLTTTNNVFDLTTTNNFQYQRYLVDADHNNWWDQMENVQITDKCI
jgi:hypothetical protein